MAWGPGVVPGVLVQSAAWGPSDLEPVWEGWQGYLQASAVLLWVAWHVAGADVEQPVCFPPLEVSALQAPCLSAEEEVKLARVVPSEMALVEGVAAGDYTSQAADTEASQPAPVFAVVDRHYKDKDSAREESRSSYNFVAQDR